MLVLFLLNNSGYGHDRELWFFFAWQSIGLVSWGIVEVEKYLTVFSLCRFKNTPKKLPIFVNKTCHFLEEIFFLKNKPEEIPPMVLAKRCRGHKTTYRFIWHFSVTLKKGLKFDRNRGVDRSTFTVFSNLTLRQCF